MQNPQKQLPTELKLEAIFEAIFEVRLKHLEPNCSVGLVWSERVKPCYYTTHEPSTAAVSVHRTTYFDFEQQSLKKIEQKISMFNKDLLDKQEPLGSEFEQILEENLNLLYVYD